MPAFPTEPAIEPATRVDFAAADPLPVAAGYEFQGDSSFAGGAGLLVLRIGVIRGVAYQFSLASLAEAAQATLYTRAGAWIGELEGYPQSSDPGTASLDYRPAATQDLLAVIAAVPSDTDPHAFRVLADTAQLVATPGAATRVGGGGVTQALLGDTPGFAATDASETITGRAIAERIRARGGDDTVSGLAGDDTLLGEAGHDSLLGGGGRDSLEGGAGDDSLAGGAGDDSLAGGAGDDSLAGGAGDDRYHVEDAGDRVIEAAGGGNDTVYAMVSHGLRPQVEALLLLGSAPLDGSGNASANRLTGNGGANRLAGLDGDDTLFGLAGNDTLDGGGGIDSLAGGAGNDTYLVDDAGDRLAEATGQGTDLVMARIGFSLGAGFEDLTLLGEAGLRGAGNGLANHLVGTAGADTLLGGAGDDTLRGGAGDDRLDGGGGADSLAGGAGNDSYLVDATGDAILERAGEGADLVMSRIGWTLGAQLEQLALLGSAAIDGRGNGLANRLTGNAAANRLEGEAGADSLGGGGGADTLAGGGGRDRLEGGGQADLFLFATPNDGPDEILDFSRAQGDRIALAGENFGGLPSGALAEEHLALDQAGDADDFLIFHRGTQRLLFDFDGNGSAGSPVAVATLHVATLSAADILIL